MKWKLRKYSACLHYGYLLIYSSNLSKWEWGSCQRMESLNCYYHTPRSLLQKIIREALNHRHLAQGTTSTIYESHQGHLQLMLHWPMLWALPAGFNQRLSDQRLCSRGYIVRERIEMPLVTTGPGAVILPNGGQTWSDKECLWLISITTN